MIHHPKRSRLPTSSPSTFFLGPPGGLVPAATGAGAAGATFRAGILRPAVRRCVCV